MVVLAVPVGTGTAGLGQDRRDSKQTGASHILPGGESARIIFFKFPAQEEPGNAGGAQRASKHSSLGFSDSRSRLRCQDNNPISWIQVILIQGGSWEDAAAMRPEC